MLLGENDSFTLLKCLKRPFSFSSVYETTNLDSLITYYSNILHHFCDTNTKKSRGSLVYPNSESEN